MELEIRKAKTQGLDDVKAEFFDSDCFPVRSNAKSRMSTRVLINWLFPVGDDSPGTEI
jgi:hypothetical protein